MRVFILKIKEKLNKKFAQRALKFFLSLLVIIIILFAGVFLAMRFNLTNVEGSVDAKSDLYNSLQSVFARKKEVAKVPDWATTDDWKVIKRGLTKDKAMINKVSRQTGLSTRTILAPIVVEQFRYFGSNRELLKKVFLPLQALGNSVKFSYGIAGVKIATAQMIENNLKDRNSPYYLGKDYEHLLDFQTKDKNKERMDRLTDESNHYYSYLYTALFIKQIQTEWGRAGYTISDRPEILATLFNLGYKHSDPKENPEVGGSNIMAGKKTYTFGGLAFEFFYSAELAKTFPIK